MEPSSRFLRACRRLKTDATPVWFMRQAGRYLPEYRRLRRRMGILQLCENPRAAAEATLQPVRRLGVDAAILFSDILLPLRPMGVKLEFRPGEGPALSPAAAGAKEIAALRLFEPEAELGCVLEAIRLARRELGEKTPLIGFAGAPFTLACYLIEGGPSRDFRRAKLLMRSEPGLWRQIMEKLTRMTGAYLRAQARAGAQALQVFDSWAGALSGPDYVRYVQPYSRRVLAQAAAEGVPVIHFGTGTAPFLEAFRDAGGDVVGVDWRLPLDAAWSRIGARQALQGNLDPVELLLERRLLKPAVLDVLRRARGRRGHIFNLGHGVLPETPPESARAVVEWVHEATSR